MILDVDAFHTTPSSYLLFFKRKLVAPAFTANSVKAMTPVFFQKAEELRDRWDAILSQPSHLPHDSTPPIIDVFHWTSRATFDVIGLAGFDYHFHSMHDESEDVYLAYRKMFNIADTGTGPLKSLMQLYLPWVEKFFVRGSSVRLVPVLTTFRKPDCNEKTTYDCLRTIKNAGMKIIAEKKAVYNAEKAQVEKIRDKDILSLLSESSIPLQLSMLTPPLSVKANLSSAGCACLTDSDLLDQLSTFLFAGSDSTSLALSWCIHLLSINPEIQTRLRNELLSL